MPCVEVSGLRKTYGSVVALDGIDLAVEEGHILGIVGPNGAGKTTALHALLGDRAKAEGFLARGGIRSADQVRRLSKGTVTQLHLAVVIAIDARLLVLDEPTLGLDPLARKQFYDALLHDYFDHTRTIVVTTHQIDEIQDVLTDFAFLNAGQIVLTGTMEAFESRYALLRVHPGRLDAARALGPIHERHVLDRTILLFDGADAERLEMLGDVRRPTLGDLFVAAMEGGSRPMEVAR